MKVTDWIIEFLISKGVKTIFGYPGGVICHFMDSALKYENQIEAKINYHEQASAFAACAYGQASGIPGVAFSTSGPGATNLVTGIANAYFDSVPAMFVTGQVDTYALKDNFQISQRGFQETDIVGIVNTITKYCVQVKEPEQICYEFEKAWHMATTGRRGPVLLDLPADVQRAEVDVEKVNHYKPDTKNVENVDNTISEILRYLQNAKRPCIAVGAAVKQCGVKKELRQFAEKWNIPVVSSMNAVDILPANHPLFMGFIGTNGHRCANFVVEKSDVLLTLGTRLDLKQVGNKRELFAPNAKIVRVDIDAGELDYKLRDDVISIQADIEEILPLLVEAPMTGEMYEGWIKVCKVLKHDLYEQDFNMDGHQYLKRLAGVCTPSTLFTLDVGHNEVWSAQALKLESEQEVYLSGGLGAMGYSLPAAVGVYYAKKCPVVSINGDGGFQMNLQELQFVARENLPIKIVVLNNQALGMIRHFQEANFSQKYFLTTKESGYTVPSLEALADTYKIPYMRIETPDMLENQKELFAKPGPAIVECVLGTKTYLEPKFGRSDCLADQEPLLERTKYDYYSAL